jgi:hypothetical protein
MAERKAKRWRDNNGRIMNQWAVIWSVRDSFIAGLFATLELFITAALAGLLSALCCAI